MIDTTGSASCPTQSTVMHSQTVETTAKVAEITPLTEDEISMLKENVVSKLSHQGAIEKLLSLVQSYQNTRQAETEAKRELAIYKTAYEDLN